MLTGSRLGAAFVVLVVGVIYALRQPGAAGRRAPISIGILSLLMTMVDVRARRDRRLPPARAAARSTASTSARRRAHVGHRHAVRLGGRPAADDVLPDWTLFPVGLARAARRVRSSSTGCCRRSAARRLEATDRCLVHAQVADVPRSAAASACSRCRCRSRSPCSCRSSPRATCGGPTRCRTSPAPTSRRWPTRSWPRSSSATRTACAWSSRSAPCVIVWTLFLLAFGYPLVRRAASASLPTRSTRRAASPRSSPSSSSSRSR